ncbi:DUF3157 family protein [Hydrogenimonas urashimensis]|uniref:DUF3157 family protein n=1 Tax=Hydrogenimonas urashimensis TaxID=2740515 RepID=UPI0019156126|nr:DUF3157 family protein [Hydrogenimonas urashimensis]
MKKTLLLSLLVIALSAGQYARLKDGTVIILKDDGTWEKVETRLPNEKAEPLPASAATPATAGHTPETTATPISSRQNQNPLVLDYMNKLEGVWESADGKLKYIIEKDKATFVDGRKKRSGSYKIQNIKPNEREFVLNIAEFGSAGYFSFGGILRKLAFSPDFSSLTDYSATIPTELKKVR